MYDREKGFVALVSSIVISAIIIILITSVSLGGFFGRFNVLDSQYKEVSNGLAESCVEFAIIFLTEDENYDPGAGDEQKVGEGDDEVCTIVDITGTWPSKTLDIQAVYQDVYTNLEIGLSNTSGISVTSWAEVPNH